MRRKAFLEVQWNKNIAYIIGLITTDGNLSKDKRHINFTSSDIQLINTFKMCLNKNNKVTLNPNSTRTKKQSYRFQFGDVNFYDFLQKIGLFPNKSLTLGAVEIPDKYFRDFLRGHLDGDGSIIHYKDYYHTPLNPKYIYDRLFVYFLSASKKHIEWLHDKIINITGLIGNLTERKYSNTIIYRIKFSTKEAKILLNWIYYKPNLSCLLRKYDIAKPFLGYT